MELKELYLKTVFCCMSCDGDIAKEEIALLEKYAKENHLFDGLDIKTLVNGYVDSIHSEERMFLDSYLQELADSTLTDDEQLEIVKLAIETIEADNKIEYSEVSFFKEIRSRLSISDDAILKEMPGREDYLLPDIKTNNILDGLNVSFDNIVFDTNILKLDTTKQAN